MSNASNSSGGPHGSSGHGGHGGQGQGGHGGRRGRRRRGPGNPGASQGKGNRPRGGAFVGPMDHSYRQNRSDVDGNAVNSGQRQGGQAGQAGQGGQQQRGSRRKFRRGGRGGGFQPQRNGQFVPATFEQPHVEPVPPSAVSPDAPPRIYAFVEDLFFLSKIQETARKMNVKVEFVKNAEDLLARVEENPADKPSLVIFDLNNVNAKPLASIPKLKATFKKSTSIMGFLSHLQGELKQKAQEAGCDSVLPRSAFSQNLPQILRRHGVPEAEELTQ